MELVNFGRPSMIELRNLTKADLPKLFEIESDAEAVHMVAFGPPIPTDFAAFEARWEGILAKPELTKKAILLNGEFVGIALQFELFDKPQVGYWLNKEHWGKGYATEALKQLLGLVPTRPLFAQAAKDNLGSRRVLEKCGFKLISEEMAFADVRGCEIAEVLMRLD